MNDAKHLTHPLSESPAALLPSTQGIASKQKWSPIESAPKDGTEIDLWVPNIHGGRRWTDCFWGKPDHSCGEAGPYCDSDWHSEKPGWVDGVFPEFVGDPPTHWMPIPEAPSVGRGPDEYLAPPGKPNPALSKEVPVGELLATARNDLRFVLETMPKDWFVSPSRRAAHILANVIDLLEEVPVGAPEVSETSLGAKCANIARNNDRNWPRIAQLINELVLFEAPSPLQTQGRWTYFPHPSVHGIGYIQCDGIRIVDYPFRGGYATAIIDRHNASLKDDKKEDLGSETLPASSDHHDQTQKALPLIPLPEGLDFRNPWPTQCDMLEGPCACGAWHRIEDLKFRIENQFYAPSARLINAAGAALLSKSPASPIPAASEVEEEKRKCPDCGGTQFHGARCGRRLSFPLE